MENNTSVDSILVEDNASTTTVVGGKKRKAQKSPLLKQRAKRHINKHTNASAGIKKASIKKFGRRAGILRFRDCFYPEFRSLMVSKLKAIAHNAATNVEHDRRKTVTVDDMSEAFKSEGVIIYGYASKKKRGMPRKTKKSKKSTATTESVDVANPDASESSTNAVDEVSS